MNETERQRALRYLQESGFASKPITEWPPEIERLVRIARAEMAAEMAAKCEAYLGPGNPGTVLILKLAEKERNGG